MNSASAADDEIKSTMKAAIATGFGDIAENINIEDSFPTPTLPDDSDGYMIVRVLACALAPGDVRLLSGMSDYFQLPESGHPYVIGSDTSGIVVAVGPKESKFKVGDYVVSRFDEPKPTGGAAEYRLVKTWLSAKCPDAITPIVACGLSASAMAAKRIVRDYVKSGDRVLVIGVGAVGSSVLQYSKLQQAGYIAAVSTQSDLCKSLGADQVIDYRKEKWWKLEEFRLHKFDIVFDLVNGENWTKGGCAGAAIQRKGVYVALLSGVCTDMEAHNAWDAVKLVIPLVGRILYSRLHPFRPKWVAPEALKLEDGDLESLLADVADGRLNPLVDPASPFDFTREGVRDAMRLQKSVHAHGKVVIKID